MLKSKVNIAFVLLLLLGIGVMARTRTYAPRIKARFLQSQVLRVSVSTYLSPPVSSESYGCFLDTIGEMTSRLDAKVTEYSLLCELKNNANVQMLFNIAKELGVLQGHLVFDPKYALTSTDIAAIQALSSTVFDDILAASKLTSELIDAAMKILQAKWESIAKDNKYPFFFKANGWNLAQFVYGLNFIQVAYATAQPTDCIPVTKTTIDIFEDSVIDLVDKDPLLIQKDIIDNKITIDPMGFTYGGYALAFWVYEDNSLLVNPFKVLQGFINNIEELTYSIADGSIIHNLVINDQTLFIRENPKCSEYAFTLLTIEKDCDQYKINLILRLSNLNQRFIVSKSFPADSIENLQISLLKNMALAPMLYTHFIYSEIEEKKVLSEMLQIFGQSIVQKNLDCSKADPKCLYYSTEQKCQVCSEGLMQFNDKCYKQCPNGTFMTEELQCEECTEQCDRCLDIDTCGKCKPGFFLFKGDCLKECPSNTFPSNGACVVCDDNCSQCKDAKTCLKCIPPTILYQGKCLTDCPAQTFKDPIKLKCLDCIDGCKICNSDTECTTCLEGFYLFKGKCVMECGNGYMKDEVKKTCVKCIDNCKECSKEGVCDTCNDSFFLETNLTCVTHCDPGQVSFKKICIDCVDKDNCLLCNANNVAMCESCKDPKVLKAGQCLDTCGDFYYKGTNNKCSQCKNNCKQCTKDICLSCEDGKFLFENDKCVSPCPDGYIPSGTICKKCTDLLCKKCADNALDVCTMCYPPKLIKEGDCVDKCGDAYFQNVDKCDKCITGCQVCKDGYTCNQCAKNYFLKDSICVTDCGEGMKPNANNVCEACTVSKCSTCSKDKTLCEKCKDGKVLYNNQCYDNCPAGSYLPKDSSVCQKCSAHCQDCIIADTCRQCENTYFLQGKVCVTACNDGSYANDKNICTPCTNSNCKKCPSTPSKCTECPDKLFLFNGDCVAQCPDGTFLNKNQCQPCKVHCNTCDKSSDNCTSCQAPFVLQGNTCVDNCSLGYANVDSVCKKCTDGNCDKCKSDNIDCCIKASANFVVDSCDVFDKCKDAKYADANGICQDCLTNCQKCPKDTTCTQCKTGFYLKNDNACVGQCGDGWIEMKDKCQACSTKCNKCKTNDLTCCTSCKDNQYSLNCECLPECPKKYWTNGSICSPCTVNQCAECIDSGKTCKKCTDGYALLDGQCVPLPCPAGTTEKNGKCEKCLVENCKSCDVSTATCQECKSPNSLLDDYHCVQSCPEGTFLQKIHNCAGYYCEKCNLHCQICKDSETCQTCQAGYVLQEGRCQKNCDDGFRAENGKCVSCSMDNCSQCTTSSCVSCGSSYYLDSEGGSCFGQCPDTKYADKKTSKCLHCSQFCKKCVDGILCQECLSPYVLDTNFKCTDQCLDKTVNINGKCTLCKTGDHCAKCATDLVTCAQCDANYFLLNNKCVVTCGDGYYPDNGKCYQCKSTCKTCKDAATCNECVDGNYLLNHDCLGDCPEFYYKKNKECAQCTTNCDKCTSDKCIHCKTGFLENGKCVPKCSTGFFLFNQYECQACSDKCITCQSKESCTQCAPGLFLSNGLCVTVCPKGQMPINTQCTKCTDNCKVCGSSLDQCAECEAGYYRHLGKCVKECPVTFYENVDKCSSCINHCDECKDNLTCDYCTNGFVYFINGDIKRCDEKCPEGYSVYNRQCIKCTADNCKTCDVTKDKCTQCTDASVKYQDKCLPKCPSKTYLDTKECKDCPTECDSCNDLKSCTKCINGYYLENKKCVSKCLEGSIPVNGECKKCTTDDCLVCLSTDVSQCTKCKTGLILKKLPSGKAICVTDCGDGFFADNYECKPCNNAFCKTCSNADQCDKCIDGKVLQGKLCQEKCNDFFVERNNECKPCKDTNCLTCDNITMDKCKKCNLPFILQNDKCVANCDVGYYLVDMVNQKQCKNCINNCDQCTNGDTCIKCTAPNVLFNGKCYSECNSGYVEVNGECKKCSQEDCLTCLKTNLDKCVKCKPDTFLNIDSICVKDCGKGFYGVNGVCKPCTDDNCMACAPENVCSKCTNGKFLYNSKCVNGCPVSTYVDMNGECKPCNDPKCKTCVSSNSSICKECLTGFLSENKCVPKCPDGTFDNALKQCQKCSSNCVKCLDEQTCTICNAQYLLTDKNTCTDNCDEGYVAIGTKCTKCTDDNCVSCSAKDVSICQECSPALFLYKGKCIQSCPAGTFISGRNCLDCEENCKSCTDKVTCNVCYPPYNVYNNDCVKDCPSNWISIANQCKKCKDDNCNKCADNLDYCNDCKGTLLNDQGKCVMNCEVGKYYDADKKKCDYCLNGCLNCKDPLTCNKCDGTHVLVPDTKKCETSCPDGTYQDTITNTCVKCDNFSCKKCDPMNALSCTDCPVDMLQMVDKNNNVQCVAKCPEKYYQQDNKCLKCVAPCNQCTNEITCIDCVVPYKFKEGQCLSDCPDGTVERNGICYTCQDQGCKNCDPNDLTKCLNCLKPNILFNYDCITTCPANYYLSDAYTCVKCDSSCETCDKKGCLTCIKGLNFMEDNSKTCVNCVAPNVVINNICKKCQVDGCASCNKADTTICDLCQAGYVAYDKKCLPSCPSGYYKKGTTCAKCDDYCLECTGSKQCYTCQDGKIKYNGMCIDSCPNYYHSNNGICEPCTQSQCLKCDPNASTCIQCKDYPLLDGQCVQKCPDGYTLSGDKCTKCSTSCVKCDSTQCYECTPGKFIKGTQCVSDCGDGFYSDGKTCIPCNDSNCQVCSDSSTCTKCKNDTYLNKLTGTCSVTCPDGFYGNKISKECTKCDEGCDKCKADGCIKCSDAYAFFNNVCVKPCPSGYTSVLQQCVKCTQDSCLECQVHQPDTCTKCKTYLNNGVCVDQCPIGTFVKNGQCTPCDSKCDKCQDETTCLKCKDEFALVSGQCLNKCGDGKVKIAGKCVPCAQDQCKECTIDINKCLQCFPTSVLYDNKCINDCPVSTYRDMDLNQCVDCPLSCAKCTKDKCQQCNPGYYMFNGQCLINCPDGYYEDCSPDTRECKPCDVACGKCVLGTNANCLNCSVGYFFYAGLCIKPSECPTGTYYDGTSCTKCNIQYCQSCSNVDTCIKCNRGFILDNGKCVEKHTLTPIIPDFELVSPYTSAVSSIRKTETYPIADYQGTGVGSSDVTFSFYVRLLSPKIESNPNILTIMNNQMSAYNIKFFIDTIDYKCKMMIEDSTKSFSYILPVDSCKYDDLFDWKYYAINFSKDGDNFIARVDTVDPITGKVVEYTLKVPNNSRTSILEPSALVILNYYTGTTNSPSNVAYHIGKLMVMDYYPTEQQIIALTKLVPSKCDYFCTSCKNVCLSCVGGVLPVDSKCAAYYIRLNEGNPVYFEGTPTPIALRDKLNHDGLVSDAYGLTTWFYVKDPTVNNQILYQVKFNKHQDKYQYLKVEILNGKLTIDGTAVHTTPLKPNQWYFLYVANSKAGIDIVIRDTDKNEIKNTISNPLYFILHYDDFIYEFGKNFKGSLFNTKIYINNNPSLDDLEVEYGKLKCPDNCDKCADDLKCSQCKAGYDVTSDGLCKFHEVEIKFTLLENIYDIWNKKGKVYKIKPTDNKYTISLMLRKKTHSNIYQTYTKHNILSYTATDPKVIIPLITEKLTKEYESEFGLVGDKQPQTWKHDFTEEVYDFIHVIIIVNGDTKQITFDTYDYLIDKAVQFTTDFANPITSLVIGDPAGYELNIEYSNIRLYPVIISPTLLQTLRKHPVPCDPICSDCNWSNGKCNVCYNDPNPSGGDCPTYVFGYHPASLYGYHKFNELQVKDDYKFLLKDYFPVNFNAAKYSVYFIGKFYRFFEGIKYRIGCITNNSYRLFTPSNDRGKNLMCFDVFVKNGKGAIEITLNDGGSFVTVPVKGLEILTLHWLTGYFGVNAIDKTFKYAFITDLNMGTKVTGEYKYTHVPEKIQESAGLTIYGAFDGLDDKLYAPPEILLEHFYIYPYNGYSEDDFAMMIQEQTVRGNPNCDDGCKICSWEKDLANCVECKPGYMTMLTDPKNKINTCKRISYNYIKFNDEIITEKKDYPIMDSSIFNGNFGLYFQILKNFLYFKPDETRTIIQLGLLKIALFKDSLFVIVNQDVKALEIPLNNVYQSWNHIFIYKSNNILTITVQQGTFTKTVTLINDLVTKITTKSVYVNPLNSEVYLYAITITTAMDIATVYQTEPYGYDTCGLDCAYCENSECKACSMGSDANGKCNKAKVNLVPVYNSPNTNGLTAQYDLFESFDPKRFMRVDQFNFEFNVELSKVCEKILLMTLQDEAATQGIKVFINSKQGTLSFETLAPLTFFSGATETFTLQLPNPVSGTYYYYIGISYNKGKFAVVFAENASNVISMEFTLQNPIAVLTYNTVVNFYSTVDLKLTNLLFLYEQFKTLDMMTAKAPKETKPIQKNCLVGTPTYCKKCVDGAVMKNGICLPQQLSSFSSQLCQYTQVGKFVSNSLVDKYKNVPSFTTCMVSFNFRITSLLKSKLGLLSINDKNNAPIMIFDYIPEQDTLTVFFPLIQQTVKVNPVQSMLSTNFQWISMAMTYSALDGKVLVVLYDMENNVIAKQDVTINTSQSLDPKELNFIFYYSDALQGSFEYQGVIFIPNFKPSEPDMNAYKISRINTCKTGCTDCSLGVCNSPITKPYSFGCEYQKKSGVLLNFIDPSAKKYYGFNQYQITFELDKEYFNNNIYTANPNMMFLLTDSITNDSESLSFNDPFPQNILTQAFSAALVGDTLTFKKPILPWSTNTPQTFSVTLDSVPLTSNLYVTINCDAEANSMKVLLTYDGNAYFYDATFNGDERVPTISFGSLLFVHPAMKQFNINLNAPRMEYDLKNFNCKANFNCVSENQDGYCPDCKAKFKLFGTGCGYYLDNNISMAPKN